VLIAALADSSRTSSSSWGLSLGFAADGITFGADLSRTAGSSRMFTNAALTAGGHLDIMSNRNTVLLGANIKADSIAMDVGADLIVQSRQNVSASQSHGFNFRVTMSGNVPTDLSIGASQSSSNRRYTDNPTTVVAQEALSIYTGDITYLLGSAIYSETGGLDLDTGSLIFDNYIDTDTSSSSSVNATIGFTEEMTMDTARSDAAGSLAYRNTTGVTYATLGAGSVRVRAVEADFTLAALNRDPDNLQQVLSRSGFALEVPGINLKRWSQQVRDMANLIEAVSAEVPDRVRVQGAVAVDLYRDMILDGVPAADARRMIGSDEFRYVLESYRQYREAERTLREAEHHYGSDAAILQNVRMALALGYGILLGEASAHEGGSFTIPCDQAGGQTECEIALDDFNEHFRQHGADYSLRALELLRASFIARNYLHRNKIEEQREIRGLLFTLRQCARSEPDVYLKFIGESDSEKEERRALIEWAGEEFGVDAGSLYVIAEVIREGGTAEQIEAAWTANINPLQRYFDGMSRSFSDTVVGLVEASEYLANVSGIMGLEAQRQTFDATLAVIQYIAENPGELTQQITDELVTFAMAVADGDPEAIGYLTGGAILSIIPAGAVTRALTGTTHAARIPALTAQSASKASVRAKIMETESWLTKSGSVAFTIRGKNIWHDLQLSQHMEALLKKNKTLDFLNVKRNADGTPVVTEHGYTETEKFGFWSSDRAVISFPDMVYRTSAGKVVIVEMKTGNAVRSDNQKLVYEQIQSGDALITPSAARVLGIDRRFIGKSLREAGFADGIEVTYEKFDGLSDA